MKYVLFEERASPFAPIAKRRFPAGKVQERRDKYGRFVAQYQPTRRNPAKGPKASRLQT
jgi:hypothetical protein